MVTARMTRVLVPMVSAGAVALIAGFSTTGAWRPDGHESPSAASSDAATHVRIADSQAAEHSLIRAARRNLRRAGTVTKFVAADGVEAVDASAVSRADGVYAIFAGPRKNSGFKVFVGLQTDPRDDELYCPQAPSVMVPSCREYRDNRGHVVEQVVVTRKAPATYGAGVYTVVGEGTDLTPADYPDLRVEHDVTIYRADGTQTSASETVYGPKSLDWGAVFSESGRSLESAATDDEVSWSALAAAGH